MTVINTTMRSMISLVFPVGLLVLLIVTVHGDGPVQDIRAVRFQQNPIITEASGSKIGNNINGPSLIRVPSWLPNPLGRYYLYFAHHTGDYIRLAYSNSLNGPWKIYEP